MTPITRRDLVLGGTCLFNIVSGVIFLGISIKHTQENAIDYAIFKNCCSSSNQMECSKALAERRITVLKDFCNEYPTDRSKKDFWETLETCLIPTYIIMLCVGLLGFGYICYTKNVGNMQGMVNSCLRKKAYQELDAEENDPL